jgi:hypothetical protein
LSGLRFVLATGCTFILPLLISVAAVWLLGPIIGELPALLVGVAAVALAAVPASRLFGRSPHARDYRS